MSSSSLAAAGRDDRLSRLTAGLEALRLRLVRVGLAWMLLTICAFPLADDVLGRLQKELGAPLAAFGVTDAFFALVSISLGLGSAAVMPYAAYQVLLAGEAVRPSLNRRSRWIYWMSAMLLFFGGVGFCLWITLPYGSRFLLGFGSEELQPLLSVRKFVSFCMILTFGFGILFELPLIMTLSAGLKLLKASTMARCRRYALLSIIAASAIVTPTPDILNLMLLAGPLYLLYEVGIVGMRICERKRSKSSIASVPAESA